MKCVIAPNEFKGTIDVFRVADIMEKACKEVFPTAKIDKIPLADGGDGTLKVLHHLLGGEIEFFEITTPLLDGKHSAPILFLPNKTAVIEVASSTGLVLLPLEKRNPLFTSTYGTGELIRKALELGAKELWLAVGGSSTVDGAMGILAALGCKFLDENGKELKPVGESLIKIKRIELSPLCKNFPVKMKILVDVQNKLLGKDGGVRTFAPQKGASPEEVDLLEKGMKNFATIVKKLTRSNPETVKGGGASGGIPVMLSSLLNAEIVPGAEFIAEKAGLKIAVKEADLLITGEGKVDRTTLNGKVPFVACKYAKQYNVKTAIVGGSVEIFDDIFQIADIVFPSVTYPLKMEEIEKLAEENLYRAAKSVFLIFKNLWGGAR